MEIREIRHRNLMALLEANRKAGNKDKDFRERTGIGPAYLSQLKAGKVMGDKVARDIDEQLELGRGWMDTPHWDAPPTFVGKGNQQDNLDEVRAAQLLMAEVLAGTIPELGDALDAAFDRLPDSEKLSDHFALLIARIRRANAKRGGSSPAAPVPKVRARRPRH